jgi:hypothetical protein
MRIRLAIPDRLVTPEALEAALEATALANEQAIIRGEVPPLTEAISDGVRWKPEPFLDGEHFDLAHQVTARKWGDCDDLAPWLAGELRATGEDPGARPRVYKSGPDRWHVVTETSDGRILDPSRWAGMGKRSSPSISGVCGTIARPFARLGEGALCCVPHEDGRWWSRVDLPFPSVDGNPVAGHIASHACARSPEDSLYRAVAGAIACGEEIDSDLVERLRMSAGMLLSDPEIESMSGDEVGSFFKSLLKPLKAIVPMAASFIPGVGPVASKAASAAMSALSKKKGQKGSAVRALSRGGGKKRPTSDTVTHPPTGAVSVPIDVPGGKQPAMLYYHPANAIGPVVMRF